MSVLGLVLLGVWLGAGIGAEFAWKRGGLPFRCLAVACAFLSCYGLITGGINLFIALTSSSIR